MQPRAFIDKKLSIPKTIHQIWIGDKNEPTYWTESFKHIPGFKHVLWNEQKIGLLKLRNQKQYDYYYKNKNYAGASDIARAEIIQRYGGIYVDADFELLKKWRDWPFLDSEIFFVQANTLPSNHFRIANGIFGATPNHPIINEYVEHIGKTTDLEPAWDTIGGTLLTQIVEQHQSNPHILEPYWFFPYNSRGIPTPNGHKAICRHHWGSTKRKGTGQYV